MKKVVLLFVLVISCSLSLTAQEAGNDAEKKGESRFWGESSIGMVRINTPLFADTEGNTYLSGQFSSGISILIMRELPKTKFSLGGSLWYNHLDTRLQNPTFIASRFLIGPAAAFKTPFKEKGDFYITAKAGLKWDIHRNELPSGYLFCQNPLSLGGSLSVAYAFRSRNAILNGMGIKGTIYSYGNSREARNAHIKDPFVDCWEVSFIFYHR